MKVSIFDEIGKKISDVGQETTTKAKNFAEITKMNGLIDDEEKQITKLFLEIGQSYYENHKNDISAEEKERVAAVSEIYERIAQYKEQIRKIKSEGKCPVCGAEVSKESLFCSSCGAKIEREEPTGRRCPRCHLIVGEEDIFCNECGYKLIDDMNTVG